MSLTRSRKHRLIAGVCGGIAERLGWSPILVRILYIVIPFAGIPLYIILWIVIPQAPAEGPELGGTTWASDNSSRVSPRAD